MVLASRIGKIRPPVIPMIHVSYFGSNNNNGVKGLPDLRDLELILKSATPLVVIESHDEDRVCELVESMAEKSNLPLFKWSITDGLHRLAKGFSPQQFNREPHEMLRYIRSLTRPGIFLLLDFHPYLGDPMHIRLIREIAQRFAEVGHHLIFLSPAFEVPTELTGLVAKLELALPNEMQIETIVRNEAAAYMRAQGRKVVTDRKAVQLLVRNLLGLTRVDVTRLARKAICDDGAITPSDIREVMEAKYRLMNVSGVLSFEYETARFGKVGGLSKLKEWLSVRQRVFQGEAVGFGLEAPKGVLLLGVQGCGKSLAAKAVAGVWDVPLLRLDFGALYNKYIGETEKNLRDALRTAEVMAPCVLWVDEIEKGLAGGDGDDGVSRRVLGTLLTWMAERKKPVFLVATANDVTGLPPELLRKGRFDEIFFVDLPDEATRALIFQIHLKNRNLQPSRFDLDRLAKASPGFSGAEIEQAIVSSLYASLATSATISMTHLLEELGKTKPLSVVMKEKIDWLRNWARERTVPAN